MVPLAIEQVEMLVSFFVNSVYNITNVHEDAAYSESHYQSSTES